MEKFRLKEYVESVKKFIEDTKKWEELDFYKFYTSYENEWIESSDNANGGLDVSWAFHKNPTDDEIREVFVENIKNLLDNLIENDVKDFSVELKNLD